MARFFGFWCVCGLGLWLLVSSCGGAGVQNESLQEQTALERVTGVDASETTRSSEPSGEGKQEGGAELTGEPGVESIVESSSDDASTAPEPEPVTEFVGEATVEKSVPEPPPTDTRKDKEVSGGSVSGTWCGKITVKASVTVEEKKTLTICAGSEVQFARSAGIVVLGTLELNGAKGQRVKLTTVADRWSGLQVTGTLKGTYATFEKAKNGVYGRQKSKVALSHSNFNSCPTPLRLEEGGVFQFVRIVNGATMYVTGGVLKMSDSYIDLKHPKKSPDCIDLTKGGMELNHVHVTGCHCPIHINEATLPVRITNSIFDGAAYPFMVAKTKGRFQGNHILGGTAHILDIGGGSSLDVSSNYWGGKKPNIQTGAKSQFSGADKFSSSPFKGVGPR